MNKINVHLILMVKNMLKENIINLRNSFGYSQEEGAEKIGNSGRA